MIKIGITGQAGFIGTHLYNTLGLYPDRFERIPFLDEYFLDTEVLDAFVRQCDVIVHLAAMNRHADINVLYDTNIGLVQKLIDAMERTATRPYVIMSSSLQEERDNLYGKSKRDGRELFNKWADRNEASFTGLIIPNVYGPFGAPYYNSVIATFSHQVMIGEEPRIEVDASLKLIYVGDLVDRIISLITENTEITEKNSQFSILNCQLIYTTENTEEHRKTPNDIHKHEGEDNSQFSILNSQLNYTTENTEDTEDTEKNSQFSIVNSQLNKPERLIFVEHQAEFRVSELLAKLRGFHATYVVNGVFPDLGDYFDLCLFNTFRSYLPMDYFPRYYVKHSDPRGDYVEICRAETTGQNAYSTTVPGITRGNHFHTRKVERFAVIKGKASIKLRKYGTDEVVEYLLDSSKPGYVDMPVWFTHNLTNIGDEELVTLFWINEFFDPKDPDTYFEEV